MLLQLTTNGRQRPVITRLLYLFPQAIQVSTVGNLYIPVNIGNQDIETSDQLTIDLATLFIGIAFTIVVKHQSIVVIDGIEHVVIDGLMHQQEVLGQDKCLSQRSRLQFIKYFLEGFVFHWHGLNDYTCSSSWHVPHRQDVAELHVQNGTVTRSQQQPD